MSDHGTPARACRICRAPLPPPKSRRYCAGACARAAKQAWRLRWDPPLPPEERHWRHVVTGRQGGLKRWHGSGCAARERSEA